MQKKTGKVREIRQSKKVGTMIEITQLFYMWKNICLSKQCTTLLKSLSYSKTVQVLRRGV